MNEKKKKVLTPTYGEMEGVTPNTTPPITTPTYGEMEKGNESVPANPVIDSPVGTTPNYGTYGELISEYDAKSAELDKKIAELKSAEVSYAEGAKLAAEKQAEINREADMIAAENAYAKARSTYGAKAEALASMGLTGSGYSDYLEAQAYAANRADVQNAIAREQTAKRAAESAYNDTVNNINVTYGQMALENQANTDAAKLAMKEKEITYKEGIANDIISKVSDGTYTKEQAASVAKLYGIPEDKISNIGQTADTLKKEEVRTTVNYSIESGDISGAIGTAETAYANGDIGKDEYQEAYFKATLYNCRNASTNAEIKAMQDDIKNLLSEGKITKTDAESLTSYLYAQHKGSVASTYKYKVTAGKFGEFSIKISGKTYNTSGIGLGERVESDTGELLTSMTGKKNPEDGTLVIYDGTMYALKGDRWIRLVDKDGLYDAYKSVAPSSETPKHSPEHSK